MPFANMIDACTSLTSTSLTSANPFYTAVVDRAFTTPPANKITDEAGRNWVFKNADKIEEIIAAGKKEREDRELLIRQNKNKYYRSFVKHVKFSGNTCIVYWNDGTTTKSHWDRFETFDPEKAILAAIARKHFGDTNIYCEVLKKYAGDGWDYYEENILPQRWEDIWEIND